MQAFALATAGCHFYGPVIASSNKNIAFLTLKMNQNG